MPFIKSLKVSLKTQHLVAVVLSLTTGLLLSLVYNIGNSFPLIFIAFAPLFYLESYIGKNKLIYWILVYTALVIWNASTALWIYKINQAGAIIIIFCNSLIFTLPFIIYNLFRKRLSFLLSASAFISCWLALEYLHTNWQLAFPYLTIGYTLSKAPFLIQWYEFSGVHGGTLWVLAINLFIYKIVFSSLGKVRIALIIVLIFTIAIPVSLSLHRYHSYKPEGQKVNFLVLHPNTDCYNYKYNVNEGLLIDEYLKAISTKIDSGTNYIVLPETAITARVWYHNISKDKRITKIKRWLGRYPNANLVTGIFIDEHIEINPWVKTERKPQLKSDSKGNYFFSYNAAIQVSSAEKEVPVYTKRKLVPIEEITPYPPLFLHLSKFFKSLGGFRFSSRAENEEVFTIRNSELKLSPIICYESIFGEYVSSKVKSGANIIAVMLNEGWYQNLPASWHFVDFSIVRAIENRRSIVRSSNMGVTCLIDERGELTQTMSDFKSGVLKGSLTTNSKLTFYTKHGDNLGKAAMYVTILLISVFVVSVLKHKAK